MKTFGKRDNHIELDPWAKRAASENNAPRSIAEARMSAYAASLVALGIIAFASFQYLVMA